MKSSWSFKKKANSGNTDVALNITAMADIMTILLVFLLKSFSTNAMNISPVAGLTLPNAEAKPQSREALKLQVSEDAITIEDQPVTALKLSLIHI